MKMYRQILLSLSVSVCLIACSTSPDPSESIESLACQPPSDEDSLRPRPDGQGAYRPSPQPRLTNDPQLPPCGQE